MDVHEIRLGLRMAVTWILLAVCAGCATTPPSAGGPYFSPSAGDPKQLQNLIKKQEAVIAKCGGKSACDHVLFMRALAGLYENQETALRYFERVIAVAPKGPLAASSRSWIQLLQSGSLPLDRSWLQTVLDSPAISRHNVLLTHAMEQTVRDLLDREMTIQQLRSLQEAESQSMETLHRELHEQEKKMEALSSKREPGRMSGETGTLQSLQRQLNDRDRKIEELSSQLEALKRIDQEMREKVRPIRPPSNAVPLVAPEANKP